MIQKSFPLKSSPNSILSCLRRYPFSFLLESSDDHPLNGRYSFLGADPYHRVCGRDKVALHKVKKLYDKDMKNFDGAGKLMTPFPAGLMGYLSYDFGLRLMDIPTRHRNEGKVPDIWFGFYDVTITLDHWDNTITVSSSGLPAKDIAAKRDRARQRLKEFVDLILDVDAGSDFDGNGMGRRQTAVLKMKQDISKIKFLKQIRQAQKYIADGDIYQVNLSQRFSIAYKNKHPNPLEVYNILRRMSPTSFSSYLDGGSFQIISSSPERFLKSDGSIVETRPMKGTRPRGKTPAGDRLQKKALLNSRKDEAELLMITDLERNDLGRVCEYGSVQVASNRDLETYKTVFQTTSTIKGRLQKGTDVFDLLLATFPGGSITGCPKIRAMQIIDELESCGRSIYTGSMGYMSFTGKIDFNVLIRTLLMTEKEISFHVGGGIVADSTPDGEYEETLVKAEALRRCLAHFGTSE